jgi:hypothetical protein
MLKWGKATSQIAPSPLASVLNIYDIWMLTHLKRICLVIDDLPLEFKVSQQSEAGESGPSQGLENHHLSDQTSHDGASLDEADSQSSLCPTVDSLL